ncbi:MAG: DNA-binding domain-containing protein [Rectinemataceae bacterium]|jgi:hypothetical protein
MALKIRAVRNNLGTSESPYYALAAWSELIETEDFIDRMAAGRTTLSKTDIVAVFQLAREELTHLLAEGCYVKTPLGSAIPRATGKLDSPFDPFQPGRMKSGHGLRFDFRLDPKIEREALSTLRCQREASDDLQSPRLISVRSIQTGREGEAQSGDLIRISGKRMKFDPADESQGLFFRSSAGEEIRASLYAHIQPSAIVAALPAELAMGDYGLIIKTVSRKGTRLEGIFQTTLRVVGTGGGN